MERVIVIDERTREYMSLLAGVGGRNKSFIYRVTIDGRTYSTRYRVNELGFVTFLRLGRGGIIFTLDE